MPFSSDQIEGADPSSWTGKSTSLVYESAAETSAWLVARGFAAFSGLASNDLRELRLLRATEWCEAYMRSGNFEGMPIARGQAMVWPARGAYDHRERLLGADVAPPNYLAAIRRVAEEMAAESFLPRGDMAGVTAVGSKRGRLEYDSRRYPESLASCHPEIHMLIQSCLPGQI